MFWIIFFYWGEDEILVISIVFLVCIYVDFCVVLFIFVRVFFVVKDCLNWVFYFLFEYR